MKYLVLKFMLLLFFLFKGYAIDAFSQRSICGKVTDLYSKPLYKVLISVKGNSGCFTFTDKKGTFSLPVPDSSYFLIFSLAGMKNEEIDIRNRSEVNISLEKEDRFLGEVVIIGYRTVIKANLYSIVVQPDFVEDSFTKECKKLIKMLNELVSPPNVEMIRYKLFRQKNEYCIRVRPIISGKIVARIYINGKAFYGSKDNIPIDIIESIQIKKSINSYPFEFNPDEDLILIKTKKRKDSKRIDPILFKKDWYKHLQN